MLIPRDTEAALLIEQDGTEAFELRERLHRLIDRARRSDAAPFGTRVALDLGEMDLFWSLASKIRPVLYRMKGANRPVPAVEDCAVPPQVLPEFLVRMQNVLKRRQVTASLFAHAGQGQLHLEPFLNLASREDVEKLQSLAEDFYREVIEVGGTISGEHACGLSRTPFIRQQYGELYEVFREVKQIFDPQNLLNPGKIIGDDPQLLTRYVRVAAPTVEPPPADEDDEDVPEMRDLIELQLNWNPALVNDIAFACNGCGDCRSQAAGLRMCPIFRILPAEEASPRAKANLIRGVLAGQLELDTLTSSEFKAVADLCVNCHICHSECPAGVDIPRLVAEAKGAYVAAKGVSFEDWVATHLDLLDACASPFATVANWALGNRRMRWLLEKTLGIAHRETPTHRRGASSATPSRARSAGPRDTAATRWRTSSTPMPTITTCSWPKPWSPYSATTASACMCRRNRSKPAWRPFRAATWTWHGAWHATIWTSWRMRSGRDTTSWPPSRRPRCAWCGNTPTSSTTKTHGWSPRTPVRPAVTCGNCIPWDDCDSI